MKPSAIGRFWAQVDRSGECWLWTGPCGPHGYGLFQDGKRRLLAHRVAYHLAHGAMRERKVIRHTCRNRQCVNPDHLVARSRHENASGVEVSARDALAMRERYARGGVTQQALATQFKVSVSTVRRVLKGLLWPSQGFARESAPTDHRRRVNDGMLLAIQEAYYRGNISQAELAVRFHVSQPTVSRAVRQLNQEFPAGPDQ